MKAALIPTWLLEYEKEHDLNTKETGYDETNSTRNHCGDSNVAILSNRIGNKGKFLYERVMMNKLKEIWADILLFAALGWILAHLVMIRLYRQVLIQEPNPVILIAEIIVTALLVCFSIERFIKDVKK